MHCHPRAHPGMSHLYCLPLIERHLRDLRPGASSRTGAPAGGVGVLLTFGLHGNRIPGAQAEMDFRSTLKELETKSGSRKNQTVFHYITVFVLEYLNTSLPAHLSYIIGTREAGILKSPRNLTHSLNLLLPPSET